MHGKDQSKEDGGSVENARLSAIYDLDVLDSPPEREFDSIVELAADRFNAPVALISLVSSDRQWFKARIGLDMSETPRDVSFCAHAIQTDDVTVINDAMNDCRFADNPLVIGNRCFRFYAGAPLILDSGERLGTLCVLDTVPRRSFDERAQRTLRLMARQVVDLLEIRRLRQSDRIARLIDATSSDAIICADLESRIIHWNGAAERMFGWSVQEALGRPLDLIIPEPLRARHHAGMNRLRAGGEARLIGATVEVPAVHRTGHEVPIELSLGMWADDSDNVPNGFVAIIRDVTVRKQLERERDATQIRLAEQVSAIGESSDGFAITDSDGVFTFMNPSHASMFGYADLNDLIGQHWSILYGEDERKRIENQVFPILIDHGAWRGNATGRGLDGAAIDQEVSLSLRSDGSLVCVTRDIGERQSAERETTLLREQLLVAQRQEAVGQLATGIAHDFNNLIAAISGSAALIRTSRDREACRQAERIEEAATAAADLVAKILLVGARKSDYRKLDVGHKIENVARLVRPSLQNRHRLMIQLPDDPVVVEGDSTEFMQVLLNLLVNARDALPLDRHGQILVRVDLADMAAHPLGTTASQNLTGPAARIQVHDTGCGIPIADLDRIFEPLYSSKGANGSGIGLSVVKGIVEGVGGSIAVHSELGEGTSFEIFWPITSPNWASIMSSAPLPQSSEWDRAEAEFAALLAGKAVLVVDDHPAVVGVLSDFFETAGAEVGPCLDANDALAAIIDSPDSWALLVTDYDMPGIDGAALAKCARQLRPDLPILLCTALTGKHVQRESNEGLFDAIVGKPVTRTNLLAGAAAAIANREVAP